jgi:hypothetical protein
MMNSQTKIIVACTLALISVDIGVRGGWLSRHSQNLSCTDCAGSGGITVRELRLVDSEGNLKAHMYTDQSGDPGLVLYDQTGAQRAQLDTFNQVPSLILNAPDERRSVYFGMDYNGQSVMTMYGENGTPVASMDASGSQPVFWTNPSSLP